MCVTLSAGAPCCPQIRQLESQLAQLRSQAAEVEDKRAKLQQRQSAALDALSASTGRKIAVGCLLRAAIGPCYSGKMASVCLVAGVCVSSSVSGVWLLIVVLHCGFCPPRV
jgi:hypothetical protein